MANTYKLIETVNVTSSVPTVVFSNIPQTYTDLVLCGSARASTTVVYGSGFFRFNELTSGYDNRRMVAYATDNGKSFSDSGFSGGIWGSAVQSSVNAANWFSPFWLYIPNYAGSQVKITGGDTSYQNTAIADTFYLQTTANRTGLTSAITSLTLLDATGGYGNTLQYSTFSLYGISKL